MEQFLLKIQNKKFQGFLFILLGIGVAFAAQITLLYSPQDLLDEYFLPRRWWEYAWNNTSPIPGISLYILAGIFFMLGLDYLKESSSAFSIHTDAPPRRKPKFGFWLSSLGLAGWVAVYVMQPAQNDSLYGYFFAALWILSIVLFVVSVLIDEGWHAPSADTILQWLKAHRVELFVVATILIAAFLIRFLDLELHPYSLVNDEGEFGRNGLCILQGDCRNFFYLEGWSGQPIFAFLPYTISIAIFGKTALAVRMVSAITGTLSILALYLFAREVFDKRIAWVSASLLATLPVHIQFSRLGVDNIITALIAPLILWLLFRGAKRGSTLSFLAAGLLAGFCAYTYPGALLAAVLGIGALAYLTVQKRGFLQAHIRNILFFILAAVVVATPIMGNLYMHSDILVGRFKGEGIIQNGALQREIDTTGTSAAEILLRQFARSSLVYIATAASSNFYNSPEPYLIPLTAVLFMLGLVLVIWRIEDPRFMVVFVWYWAPVILGSTLTNAPPAHQRMLISMPALVMIIALCAVKIIESARHVSQKVLRFAPVILLGLVIYTGFVNITFYFNTYRSGHFFEDPTNEFSYETRTDIVPLHHQGHLYTIGNPFVGYSAFANLAYLAPDVEKSEFNAVSREALAALPDDKDALFIALPEFKSDLALIVQWIPGGEWQEVKRRYQPTKVLYYSYKITQEQLKGFNP